ncbi:MAG: T-protein [Syntrophorhabdaceae bacterium PtaU1.Bin034]|nr:MAG: T-protein [Syntrophorhabdaceae bacterium PtaU1.Bin034]
MKIAIVGTGHMGSWFARELSKGHEVAVYDRDLAKSERLKGVRHLAGIAAVGEYDPKLLINAVTLRNTVEAFEAVSPYLKKDCIICDMASIKERIAGYYTRAGFDFVSIHPMFGPTFADMEKVREENAVIITESCEQGGQFFTRFFARLGVRIFEYSFDEHDAMMAYSLTTPFVSSMIFAACVDAKTAPGTTFKRHMAIAGSLLAEDDHLLAEILFNPHSVTEINRITSRLEFLKHIIMAKDQDEAAEFFRRLRENIGGI